ncbi:MAG: hypothetical protein JRM99_06535 [Nitrososphaerota archaeon]|nr:hypothetical protein [Nitrososphaerota archaeon]
MITTREPWLRPFEFQLIQRMYLRFGIWSGEELMNDLEHWVRNDPRQEWWVNWFEHSEHRFHLRGYLGSLAGEFFWSVTDYWDAHRYATKNDAQNMLSTQERLGPARLVWEHKGYISSRGHYSVDHYIPRLENLFYFRLSGQRAGSEWHKDMVTEYANILQSKGRWVAVDTGAVESQLPDISVWTPHSPTEWWSGGAIEVEMEATRKSDEAILRNLRKNEKKGEPVRFVVMSERDHDRVRDLVQKETGTLPVRVENYPGQLNHLVEIEVVDPPSGHPYYDFLQSDKVPGEEQATQRSLSMHPKLLTRQEQEKEKRDREEAEMPGKWELAWQLHERGDDTMLTRLRRAEYQKKLAAEDERWLADKRKRGGPFRLVPRRHWPKPDT